MRVLTTKPIENEWRDGRSAWNVDRQGRVTHRGGSYSLHHQAKTLYIRDMGLWTKLGYWCDSCKTGLLLETQSTDTASRNSRSTEDVVRLD